MFSQQLKRRTPLGLLLVLVLTSLVLVQGGTVRAEIQYVGQMEPRDGRGSPVLRESGSTEAVQVRVQTYKEGVTEAEGQGAGLQCFIELNAGFAEDAADIEMSYAGDRGNNDVYLGTIPLDGLADGAYGFTTYCTDDAGATRTFQLEAANDTQLLIGADAVGDATPALPVFNLQPAPPLTTTVNAGDTAEFSVDVFRAGVTDAASDASAENLQCNLFWDGVDNVLGEAFDAEPMSYAGEDAFGVETWNITIDTSDLELGTYGYTANCTFPNGDNLFIGSNSDYPDGFLKVQVAPVTIQYVGQAVPRADFGAPVIRASADEAPVPVRMQVYADGVTQGEGQGAGIQCFVDPDWSEEDIALTYNRDIGNNDVYVGEIDISTLPDGEYGFLTYCTGDGGTTRVFQNESGDTATELLIGDDVTATPFRDVFELVPQVGTNVTATVGDPVSFSLRTFREGVTNADTSAPGENLQCLLWWDGVDRIDGEDFSGEAMTYDGENALGIETWRIDIDTSDFPPGTYEYTAACEYDGANDRPFVDNGGYGDGVLLLKPDTTQTVDLDFVGNQHPRAGEPGPVQLASGVETASIDVRVQVFESGVTEGAGQGADIQCFIDPTTGFGEADDIPMNYVADIFGNNDVYFGQIDVSNFADGVYEFTTYCTGDFGASRKYASNDNNDNIGQILVGQAPVNPAQALFNLEPPRPLETVLSGDETFTVSLEAFRDGVTNVSSASDGTQCFFWWDGVDDRVGDDFSGEAMTYAFDTFYGSEKFQLDIDTSTLPDGTYEYTAACLFPGDGDNTFINNSYNQNGALTISSKPDRFMSNMQPPAGQTYAFTPQEADETTFEVTVDFTLDGVTDSPGLGVNPDNNQPYTCIVWWDGADGSPGDAFGPTDMVYLEDANSGFSDRWKAELDISDLPNGSYGYTTRCNIAFGPRGGDTNYWFGLDNSPADGTIFIGDTEPPQMRNHTPPAGETFVIAAGSDQDVTFGVEFFFDGLTNADPDSSPETVSCELFWDGVDGIVGSAFSGEAMNYVADTDDGFERFELTIEDPALTLDLSNGSDFGFTYRCLADGQVFFYNALNGTQDGILSIFSPTDIASESALFINADTIGWQAAFVGEFASAELHALDPSDPAATVPPTSGSDDAIALMNAGTIGAGDFPKFPGAAGYTEFTITDALSDLDLTGLLRNRLVIAGYDANGDLLEATGLQLQGVLDDRYPVSAVESYLGGDELGVNYNGDGTQTLHLWAPTAQSVAVEYYGATCGVLDTSEAMTFDTASGVWSYTSNADWDRDYYRYNVVVYSPYTGQLETNIVTDPYSVSLSLNEFDFENEVPLNNQCTQVVDLNDPALIPQGWDALTKPALPNFEDITIYELHMRDFSVFDETVSNLLDRGTFRAFLYDGRDDADDLPLSDGMAHLLDLQEAGLTHLHLLPLADSGIMVEDASARIEPDYAALAAAAAADPDTDAAALAFEATRNTDGFNWGYETQHFGVPEGAYSTDPDSAARVLEMRQMVQALNENGLRVVMDVVYNHHYRAQQESGSVLDKIVPGYYVRLNDNGNLYNTSCCPDSATEFDMMEKLMIDTLEIWAEAYRVDGFRFDLMGFHTVDNMRNVRDALDAIDPTIAIYGEGWDFGSLQANGFGENRATQFNLDGTGIGTFNDRIRDGVHGGFNNKTAQGFINGQGFDPNGVSSGDNVQTALNQMDRIRVGLAGNLQTFVYENAAGNQVTGADQGIGYTSDPQENVPYISKHDNETLFDLNVYKLPRGENGSAVISVDDRVRSQNVGQSIVALSQGMPFFHAGSDLLRSKSLDRNSYDSGDWFNRLDFTFQSNNFPSGLPPAPDNQERYGLMTPYLNDGNIAPGNAQIERSRDHFLEFLRIRYSTPLFRLTTAQQVNERVQFYNTGPAGIPGVIVMSINDGVGEDLDPENESVWVIFNANDEALSFAVEGMMGDDSMTLHPVLQNSSDPIVQTSSWESATSTFNVPARTTAVFLSDNSPIPPSTIQFVGNINVDPGQGYGFEEDSSDPFTYSVEVYQEGVTEPQGRAEVISCFLTYRPYVDPAAASVDVEMSYAGDAGNNDLYGIDLDVSSIPVGNYEVDSYCTRDDEQAVRFNQNGTVVLAIHPAPTIESNEFETFVHLFEWDWTDIQNECSLLADLGYTGVQVSPPQEHVVIDTVDSDPWFTRYQPVSYILNSRNGTPDEFAAMVNACNAVGVDIYVDAVINHMAGRDNAPGVGSAGTTFEPYDFPDYDLEDFHFCGPLDGDADNISDFTDRFQVQTCELVNLMDLDTGSPDVQQVLTAYIQGLADLGVAGIRVDAAKHMAAWDLEPILKGLNVPDDFYIFLEVIGAFGEDVIEDEYLALGDVTEFQYHNLLDNTFQNGDLSALQGFQNGDGYIGSGDALVFVTNHDEQRKSDQGAITYSTPEYTVANLFALAYPYGQFKVMSSYAFEDVPNNTDVPPTSQVYDASGTSVNCVGEGGSDEWICEHRDPAIAAMVGFRAEVGAASLNNWQNINPDAVGFGRGTLGFFAVNKGSEAVVGQTFTSRLPQGTYCDLISGGPDGQGGCNGTLINVNANGGFTADVPALGAIAFTRSSEVGFQPAQVSITPADGAQVADYAPTITLTFNQPVDIETADALYIGVGETPLRYTTDPTIPRTTITTLTVTLDEPLLPETTVTVRLTDTAIRDDNGGALDGDADGVAGGDFVATFSTTGLQTPTDAIQFINRLSNPPTQQELDAIEAVLDNLGNPEPAEE